MFAGYMGGSPPTNVTSGGVDPGDLTSGAVVSGNIASGQIGRFHIANGAVQSGSVASGCLDRLHQNSGCQIEYYACEMALSGIRAVAYGSGGCFIVAAERASGLRLPAIGVVAGTFVSGDVCPVVVRGRVGVAFSGGIASGVKGHAYVGSGGLIINLSGFMDGASSGHGAAPWLVGSGLSGIMVQRIGVFVSGGLYVMPDSNISSGLLSGSLMQF